MKKLYWRPREVSQILIVLIAIASLSAVFAVEKYKRKREQPYNKEKKEAAETAARAFTIIKAERKRRFTPISRDFDPALSGLIGPYMSYVTTVPGTLTSKQTAANPNFAAILVHYFRRLDLKQGDLVAIGYSGSFPALNICVLSAVHALKLRPIIVSSVGASGFGANIPDFLWIDMERVLATTGMWRYRSAAASMGGIGDRASGMQDRGKERILSAIRDAGVPFLDTKSYEDGVEQRMKVFDTAAGDLPIKVYVNVGGGTLSVGTTVGKHLYEPGLNRRAPPGALDVDSVMTRFMKRDIPLIHLTNIPKLAERFGLPVAPQAMPKPGEGKIFSRQEYNPWLTGGLLSAILGALFVFIRTEWGQRFLLSAAPGKDKKPPVPSI